MDTLDSDPAPAWLADLVALLAAEPDVIGIRLLGSSARGEAAGAWVDGSWQRFSDIELLVVTRGRMAAARRADLALRATALADGWGQQSPLFHVDLLLRERSRLASLPPLLFTQELREAGKTLYGPELREEIRPVDLAGLDRRNTREILFKRLWHLAESLPADWLQGRPLAAIQARGLAVSLARQALDLPTALLPEAGVLVAGYAARLAAWRAADPPFAATLAEWLGAEPVAYVADCLERRQRCEASADPAGDYRAVVAFLAGGLAWLADHADPKGAAVTVSQITAAQDRTAQGPAAQSTAGRDRATDGDADLSLLTARLDRLALRLPTLSRRLFNEGPITPGERLAVIRQCVRIAYSRGPVAALRWWRAPRKGHLAAGLVRLHAAGLCLCAGRPVEAEAFLASARANLARVHGDWSLGDAPPLPVDTVLAWLTVRREAGRGFWRVARLGAPGAWPAVEAGLV